ncbi:hypothetical protein ACI782_02780 [Geodermatophilus sp. SYSU D00703]
MALRKRPLVLAATAAALGIGGALLPGTTAMAGTPDQTVSVAAPASPSMTTAMTGTPAAQTEDYWCEWVYVWDEWGNWVYVEECYDD